jgi:hypothetical protein
VPTIAGSAVVGQELQVISGFWDSGVQLSIHWFRGSNSITGATALKYVSVEQDLGFTLYVSVTGTKANYISVEKFSTPTGAVVAGTVQPKDITQSTKPLIKGNLVVGQTLTADKGIWTSGISYSYQWLRNGQSIQGASASTHILSPQDLGLNISVSVTGSMAGYKSLTLVSDSSTEVQPAEISQAAIPVLSGSLGVGSTQTANPGVWSQGVSIAYQWLKDGSPINGAVSGTYVITSSDLGARLSVTVTGSKPGFITISKTSATTAIVPTSNFQNAPTPEITTPSGLLPGNTFSINPNLLWDDGVQMSYQWLRNGAAIPSAINSTYLVTYEDAGQVITLAVTGSKPGYSTLTKTSVPVSVPYVDFTKFVSAIFGTAEVDQTLTAFTNWDAGTTFSYQWFLDGNPISGATGSTYFVLKSDAGRSIGLRVVGTKLGFNTKSVTSGSVTIRQILVLTPKPTISGSKNYFSTLTAIPGSWDAGVSLTYIWSGTYGNPGVTWRVGTNSASYTPSSVSDGSSFIVCVVGKKSPLADVSVCSDWFGPMQSAIFPTQPKPRIIGTPVAEARLSVDVSGWLPGSTFRYRWLMNGSQLRYNGYSTTDSTLYLNTDLFSKARSMGFNQLQVEITVSKSGYADTIALSDVSAF